jgi:beta-galactosidase
MCTELKKQRQMKMVFFIQFCAIIAFSLSSCQTPDSTTTREKHSFNFDWKFALGDFQGAESVEYDDAEWRVLNVPHDWSIEGEYSEKNLSGIAGAFLPTGIGWYRKTFDMDSLLQDEKFFLEFDGVYMNSDVWINGHHLGFRPYGYISFSYDLSPYLIQGKNTIAVRVDHSKTPSGRWYTGSGIYRPVWLTKTKNIFVPQWGTFVTTPSLNKDYADVQLEIDVVNESGQTSKARIKSIILDAQHKQVGANDTKALLNEKASITQHFRVKSPELWSPEHPNMYSIQTSIYINGQLKDEYITPLGIRSIEVRGSEGFYLNGESIKFKGLSNHHDAGPVGSAVPEDLLYERLKMLKEMGCNALRTTHNPFSPSFYAMCDTMGFLVMDEAFDGWWEVKADYDYGLYFEEWWERDLKDFILRDRNHPSVVMWSLGNEVRNFTSDQQRILVDFVKSLDSSRAITQGGGYSGPHIDVAGFNGHGEFKGELEKFHKRNPDKAIIGTEITHTLQTRGVYRTRTWYRTKDNPAPWEHPGQFAKMEDRVYKIPHLSESEVFPDITKKYQSSYDNSIVRIGVREDWNRVEKYDHYLGNFRWTGFDYLGESFGWPARTANFGIIDLAGFPKDHYYLYQSLWSNKPMVHLLPHWTHPGLEGEEIPVVVYTNCESAELFLNGRSLGEKVMNEDRQLVWMVPYEPGEIKAVAKTDGEESCSKSYKTANEAAHIQLSVNHSAIKANREDVVRIEAQISDAKGIMLPDGNKLIEFEISGPAKLLGVENGDILDLSPHKINKRKAFKGKCLLLIQATNEKGVIEINAKAAGLHPATIKILSE